MQLREYFAILRRFWPVVVLLPLLAGGLSLALALGRQPAYAASARLMVTFAPPAEAGASPVPALDENSAWLITEYILDDLPIVLSSSAFAADVGAAMAAEGHPADAAAIQSGLRAEVTRHTLAPGAVTGGPGDPPRHEPGSRETAVIERGAVSLHLDGVEHELHTGDSVTFDADLPHHFANPGKEEAVLLAIVSAGLRRS